MIKLVIEEGGQAYTKFFKGRTLSIGRAEENNIQIKDPKSSRRHCQIRKISKEYKLVDLQSQNGTRVNGEEVFQKVLHNGDLIEVGSTRIRFFRVPQWSVRGGEAGVEENERKLKFFTDMEGELERILSRCEKEFGEEGLLEINNSLERRLAEKGISIVADIIGQEQKYLQLLEITRALNSEADPRKILSLIMDSIVEFTQAERGFLILLKEGDLKIAVARNFDREAVKKPAFKISRSIAEKVAKTGEFIISHNAQTDSRFTSFMSVSDLKLSSILCFPIRSKGEITGVIYLDNRFKEGLFDEKDRSLVEAFSHQVAIALENVRLMEENRLKDGELKRVQKKMQDLNNLLGSELQQAWRELDSMKLQMEEVPGEEFTFKYDYSNIVGKSQKMRRIFHLLDKVIEGGTPIFVFGESGTGKELIARAIHFNSSRKDKPFLSENCSAIPETLLESELFGYKKGAFTGADRDRKGLFELAHKGTLFLDEVGDMSLNMQKKLLRVLQEGEFRAVGGKETAKVDVRIISASNKDLKKLMEEGKFREDLFYRLNVVSIHVPPLRERKEDIPLLVNHFLDAFARQAGRSRKKLVPEAMVLLSNYRWQGNVRELENELRKAWALSDEIITPEVLSKDIVGAREGDEKGKEEFKGPLKEIIRGKINEIEEKVILEVLERTGWRKGETARILGISRPTLDAKIQRHGITKEEKGK